MKVVLFCGGEGMRIRDATSLVPKPMVPLGDRPILWHLMKYYAHFGHTQFVLCLGYKSEVIKEYFLNYKEWISNDFILSEGGRNLALLNSDIDDWEITFADTGRSATIGERLLAVRQHLEGEQTFLANYADGLTDMWLPDQIRDFEESGKPASFMVVHSPQSFHVARVAEDGTCSAVEPISEADLWFNAGYFIFAQRIFDVLGPGDDLVVEGFERLIAANQLQAYRFGGFWQAMDTFKDLQQLETRLATSDAPWQLWKKPPPGSPAD